MQQHEIEKRYQKITQLIENKYRLKAVRREDMNGPQIGIYLNDEHTMWANLPANTEEDQDFVHDLCVRAEKEIARFE